MTYLVLKDLLLQKRMLGLGFLYVIAFSFAFQSMGEGKFISLVTAVSYVFVMTGAAWEEKNTSDVLWNSLPVPRWKIVGAKYLSALVYVACVVPICWITSSVFSLVGLELATMSINFVNVVVGTMVVVLLSSFYLPVYFALGYVKSRYWNFTLFIGVVFLATTLARLIPGGMAWIGSIEQSLSKLTGNFGIPLAMVGFVAVVAGVSFTVSLYLYGRREF